MAKHEEESPDLPYDCFISFRGEDVRYKFVGHLHKELRRKGIKSFIDDRDMEIGERISNALSKAIEESRIFIIVLSENYASSKWCLDELVQILERSRDKKQRVYPIFYHVDPKDVRHQRDSYGKHMIEHEKKFGKESQKVQAWRSALSEVGGLPGKHIKSAGDRYEIDLIEEIVEKVYEYIAPKHLHVAQNPVGLEPRIKEVKSLLNKRPNDVHDVRMLGIYGLGGIGKTELAKTLYNNIVRDFNAASFLADVKDKSNKNRHLEDLQKTLLSEMKEELETELGSTDKGMCEIKRRLRKKKVLLVLDDVDDKEQLEKLAGGRDWFGKGSRIIITTREKDVLLAHQVEEMYEMTALDEQHCLELFCWNAFKQSQPKEGFDNVSLRAVGFAKRLPLALKVIGSDLALEETLHGWESVLRDYERNRPNEKIHGVLKTSYDRLGNNHKQVFLDIACFFKGEKKEYVENILDEFGATSIIKVLCRKSLLTIDDGCLKMHDLIQDMGRDIVKQEASNPGERSRLWDYDDVIDTLTEDWGSDKIQGIMLDAPRAKEVDWSGAAFQKMKRLRILIVRNILLLTEPECLPNHLRVLDWENYRSKALPSKFHPRKIIVFKLSKSHVTLPETFKNFSCLTNMDFSHNLSITQMPDVSELQNLRELRLDCCENLIAVHQTVGFLKSLAHLRVSLCVKLRIFPQKMFLPSLEFLDINYCARLEYFPEIVEEMKNPLKIYMISTAIKELPESIGILTGLVSIDISNSMKLEYLPSSFFMLPNVVSFKSGGCSQLRESFKSSSTVNIRSKFQTLCLDYCGLSDEDLFTIFCCFPNSEELIASGNNFVSVPACIKECVHLTSLDLKFCQELQKIHEIEHTNLRILNVHGCASLEEISELPSTIQKVDARFCFNLTDDTVHDLWFQAAKDIPGLEVVMAATEIPEWFHRVDNKGNPHFWTCGKFPNFSVALVFKKVSGKPHQNSAPGGQLVELDLVINGRCVPRKGYYNFRIAADHVLICDVRLLFSDKEWLGLDAFMEQDQWNLVQVNVSCQVTSSLSPTHWGVYLYPEGTNSEDVQFTRPINSDMYSPTQVPTEDPSKKRKNMIDISYVDEFLDTIWMPGDIISGIYDAALIALLQLAGSKEEMVEIEKFVAEMKGIENTWFTPITNNEQEAKPDAAGASSSGHKGSDKVQDYDPQLYEIIMKEKKEKLYDGVTDALVEAQKSFPSLDINKIRSDTFNKCSTLFSHFEFLSTFAHVGIEILPPFVPSMFAYLFGAFLGLQEAQLSFPVLNIVEMMMTVCFESGQLWTAPLTNFVIREIKVLDLIKMGRDIKQQASNPGERSRLWDFEDVIDTPTEEWGRDKFDSILQLIFQLLQQIKRRS